MTDLEKREAFEAWLFSTEKFKTRNKNFLFMLDEYGNYEDIPVLEHWETWQAAKAQAIPDSFVVVPIAAILRILDAASRLAPIKTMIEAQESVG